MAKHIDHIEWLDNVDTLDTDLGKTVVRELLYVVLLSKYLLLDRGMDFYVDFSGINNSDDAEILFNELTRDVPVVKSAGYRYATSAGEVERLLCAEGLMSGEFWNAASFIVYTVPNDAKTQVNKAVPAATDGNTLLKDKKKALVKD